MTERGSPSRILTRRLSPNEFGDDLFRGDLTDPRACKRAVKKVNAIIHIAGEKKDPTRFEAVNVLGTKNLLVAAIEEGVDRFVCVSSLGILGADPLQAKTFDENTPCRPRNEYEQSKWEAEKLVQWAKRAGLAVAILRPANIFGDLDPDKTFLTLARTVRDRRFLFLGGRSALINMIFVEDVAHAILALVGHPRAPGRIYHLSETCTIGEFVDALSQALEVGKPRLAIPSSVTWVCRTLLRVVKRFPLVFQTPAFDRLVSLNNQARFATSRLADELGFGCPVGWREGIRRIVGWYRFEGML